MMNILVFALIPVLIITDIDGTSSQAEEGEGSTARSIARHLDRDQTGDTEPGLSALNVSAPGVLVVLLPVVLLLVVVIRYYAPCDRMTQSDS